MHHIRDQEWAALEQAAALETDATVALHMRKLELEEAEAARKAEEQKTRADLVRALQAKMNRNADDLEKKVGMLQKKELKKMVIESLESEARIKK